MNARLTMFESFMDKAAPDQKVLHQLRGRSICLNDPPAYILDQMDGSGGDVSIPLATFLKDFATDESKLELVRPFIKTSEGLLNKTELEEDNDAEYIKALLAKANEATETKSAADAIYERITAQLVATGRQSAATARQSASLITAQVTTQYEYLKDTGYTKEDGSEVTLEELFADFGLEVVGPEVDVQAEFMTQAEGSEYDQAVAKGLPVDKIARETRAVEQGFDVETTYYHGTSESFDQFATPEGLAGHFTTDTETAAQHGTNVMPTYLRVQNPVTIMDEDWRMLRDKPDLLQKLKNQGYDAAVSDSTGDLIVFDPSNIRSTNAVFDPDFSVSPRVLAQQNFGNIGITETVVTEAGEVFDVTESAQSLWQEQQDRLSSLEALRKCTNG